MLKKQRGKASRLVGACTVNNGSDAPNREKTAYPITLYFKKPIGCDLG